MRLWLRLRSSLGYSLHCNRYFTTTPKNHHIHLMLHIPHRKRSRLRLRLSQGLLRDARNQESRIRLPLTQAILNLDSFILILTMVVLTLPSSLPAVELTLLYWSDHHAQHLPERIEIEGKEVEVGGSAYLAGMVDELRAGSPRTLVLVAGDEFTGTPVSSITKGHSEIEVLNRIGISAMVPGNHEFDYGWKSLVKVMHDADFPVLLANVTLGDSGQGLFPSDTVFDLGGVKVGVVGVIYQNFGQAVVREGILGLKPSDQILAVKAFVAKRREACDLLVALTHVGWEGDSAMAEAVNGLDLIIGGHSHTRMVKPRLVHGVTIVQSGPDGLSLGRLTLDVDTTADRITDLRGDLITLRNDQIKPDAKVAALVKSLERKYTKDLNRGIGTLETDWNLGRHSNLSQWAADAMLSGVREKISDRINMAVVNDGNFRKKLPRGAITERDIWEICPFENPVVTFQVSGEELIKVMHKLLRQPDEYMTWSGLRLEAVGDSIISLIVNGLEVDPYNEYAIATTGFVWEHLDQYLGIPQSDRLNIYWPNIMERDLLIEDVTSRKVVSTPFDDERWVVK